MIYIHRYGKNYGPYSEKSIRSFLKDGKVTQKDWAWITKSKRWVLLSDHFAGKDRENGSHISASTGSSDAKASEYLEKILTLVASNEQNMALDMVQSLNNIKIFEELLKGCRIEDGVIRVPDHNPPIAELFFLELIAHCPPQAQIHSSLVRETVKRLFLCLDDKSGHNDYNTVKSLHPLCKFPNLTELHLIFEYDQMISAEALSSLTNLSSLDVIGNLTNINALSSLTNLKRLSLDGCFELTNVDALGELKNLTELFLLGCDSLINLDGISNLLNLEVFGYSCSVGEISVLDNLNGLRNLNKLRRLYLSNCSKLYSLDIITSLKNLTNLNVSYCSQLTDIDALSKLSNLTKINFHGCDAIKTNPNNA